MKAKLFTVMMAVAILVAFVQPSAATISEEMVRRAWYEVAKIVEMEPLPLTIEHKDVPNAWVTNGKAVTVTTGLMRLLQSEAEIFGVLAHEAGHAKLNHYESAVTSSIGIGIAGILIGKAIGGGALGELAINVGSNLASAGISREKEVEADDFAVDVAFKGGNDPTGLYMALARLSNYGGKLEPSGFNSHPPDERRLLRIRNRILERNPSIVIPEIKQKEQADEANY